MNHRLDRIAKILLLALAAGAGNLAAEPSNAEFERAQAIEQEVRRLAAHHKFWPHYDPVAIPLAIYTGEATYLFRHPAPGSDFEPVAPSMAPVYRYPGRHPAVTSNSSADIDGQATATLLAESSRGSVPTLAAVALHEGFHVFQRARHPGWVANEGELFLYPYSDPDQLSWRRQETELLRRAVSAENDVDRACWSRAGLEARARRFAELDPRFQAYEIGNEWNEGLAQYVQLRALGDSHLDFPEAGFDATALRTRFYTVGPALGLLLDQLRPGWKEVLEADDTRPLHELLTEAVAEADPCALSATEVEVLEHRARRDARKVSQDRETRRAKFDADPGLRLVLVAAPETPLWPQGFDPLNVEVVDGGLLHSRMLKLGNDHGSVTAVDGEGIDLTLLTVAAGEHPLFNGVQRVEILGVAEFEPKQAGDRIELVGSGLQAEFEPARIETTESTVTVVLLPAP